MFRPPSALVAHFQLFGDSATEGYRIPENVRMVKVKREPIHAGGRTESKIVAESNARIQHLKENPPELDATYQRRLADLRGAHPVVDGLREVQEPPPPALAQPAEPAPAEAPPVREVDAQALAPKPKPARTC